jgi:hypothetical protein
MLTATQDSTYSQASTRLHSDVQLPQLGSLGTLSNSLLQTESFFTHRSSSNLAAIDQILSHKNSFSTEATATGTLDVTDPTNPTRPGTFRDDYLLTGLTAGQQVQLNLNSTAFDAYLQVINAATGEVVAFNDNAGFNQTNSQVTFIAQAGVDYIARATTYYSSATGAYNLVSSQGTFTPATLTSTNQTLTGTLVNTDSRNNLRTGAYYDGYLLTGLTAGEAVQVNLNSTAFDAYLQVVNAATGEIVAFNDDSNGTYNSQAIFTVQEGIDYIVRTTSYSSGETGAYTLTTRTLPVTNGTLTTTDPNNPTRSGTLSDDYLLTNLVAGQQVQINLNSGVFDTYLQVVNASTGQVVYYNDDANNSYNSQVNFVAQAGIDYIVRATSYGANAIGAYSLITNQGSLIAGTPISGNQTLSGTLVTTDSANNLRSGTYYDGYLLTNLVAGQEVQVNLNSTVFDTYLQIVNVATGQIVAFNDDFNGLNSQVTFTVQDGVDYIVRATSFSFSATGTYTLTTVTTGDGTPTPDPTFNSNYGYGLVNAAAAVAAALEESPFADVANRGGDDWGRDMINAPEVWAQGYTGEGIVIAVIDTGVDYNHSDLDDNIWVNSGEVAGDGIDNDNNGYVDDVRGWDFVSNDNNPMDEEGHGTHVSGIIAAEDNGTGITGVAYNARIMPVRVLDENGSGYVSDVAAGIRYAANNGANVINLSLGGGYDSDVEAAIQYAVGRGVVVVMASGNEYDSQPGYPARMADQYGIAVGAVDRNNRIPSFSNRAGSTVLDYVVAPGVDIYSTTPNNSYDSYNGTSMATPHVAGVAALMLSANSNLTPAQVESLLTQTANSTGITV